MKVSSSPVNILHVTPKNAEWLKATFPAHHRQLMRMIDDGKAVVQDQPREVKA